MYKVTLLKRRLAGNLWLRPAVASLFSIGMSAWAWWYGARYEKYFQIDISEDALADIFRTFAATMLSVATFTVSAMVAAASSATNSTTPRATHVVLGDRTAQLVLSAFIAGFIYSIVSLLSLRVLNFGQDGRIFLFAGLIVIIAAVLLAFLNWVDHVMRLGRQGSTVERLTQIFQQSLSPLTAANFGAQRWDKQVPENAYPIYPEHYGYIIWLNMHALQRIAQRAHCQVIITIRPGELADKTLPFAYLVGAKERKLSTLARRVKANIGVGRSRQIDEDIRFNLLNLAETADRALSPTINDPGTAVNVLNVLLEALTRWSTMRSSANSQQILFPNLAIIPLTAQELVNDCFTPIARDGARFVEIGIRLQKVLAALMRLDDRELVEAAHKMACSSLQLALPALPSDEHRERVQAASACKTMAIELKKPL